MEVEKKRANDDEKKSAAWSTFARLLFSGIRALSCLEFRAKTSYDPHDAVGELCVTIRVKYQRTARREKSRFFFSTTPIDFGVVAFLFFSRSV